MTNQRSRTCGGTAFAAISLAVAACLPSVGWADVSDATVQSLSAPDSVETRVGTLSFKDGVPTAETARAVYDTLDFTRALNVYNNSFRGASAYAIRKGLEEVAGAERRRHLLRADGRELAVPDRQRRHGLLPVGDRPQRRARW